LGTLVERDVKGLYEKALKGEIAHFTGVSDPYEEPLNPELVIESDREPPEQSLHRLVRALEEANFIFRNGVSR
jgi:adenylylsulfate kinase-like enzyme